VLFGLIVLKEKYNSYSALACIMTLLGGLWYSWAITKANAEEAAVVRKAGELLEVSGEGMYQSIERRASAGSRNDERAKQPLLPTQHANGAAHYSSADASGVR